MTWVHDQSGPRLSPYGLSLEKPALPMRTCDVCGVAIPATAKDRCKAHSVKERVE